MIVYSNFPSFYLISLFCTRISPSIPCHISLSWLLRLLLAVPFLASCFPSSLGVTPPPHFPPANFHLTLNTQLKDNLLWEAFADPPLSQPGLRAPPLLLTLPSCAASIWNFSVSPPDCNLPEKLDSCPQFHRPAQGLADSKHSVEVSKMKVSSQAGVLYLLKSRPARLPVPGI